MARLTADGSCREVHVLVVFEVPLTSKLVRSRSREPVRLSFSGFLRPVADHFYSIVHDFTTDAFIQCPCSRSRLAPFTKSTTRMHSWYFRANIPIITSTHHPCVLSPFASRFFSYLPIGIFVVHFSSSYRHPSHFHSDSFIASDRQNHSHA